MRLVSEMGQPQPSQAVVEIARAILRDAEQGKITNLIAVAETQSRQGCRYHGGADYSFALIAEAAALHADMLDAMRSGEGGGGAP